MNHWISEELGINWNDNQWTVYVPVKRRDIKYVTYPAKHEAPYNLEECIKLLSKFSKRNRSDVFASGRSHNIDFDDAKLIALDFNIRY